MIYGPPCMPQVPPAVMHPNVKFGPNVRIHDPSRVKINGMPLTTAYPPHVGGMTMVGPGYQQTTGFVTGTGFQSMQSMQVGSKVYSINTFRNYEALCKRSSFDVFEQQKDIVFTEAVGDYQLFCCDLQMH